jgi:hypothetical protein
VEPGPLRVAHAYINTNGDGYSYSDSYFNTYTNCDRNSYAYRHANTDADTDSHGYSDIYAYGYGDVHSYSHGDSYSYGDAYRNTYGNAKLHPELHIHRRDRNDRSGHDRYWQSRRRWHNLCLASV